MTTPSIENYESYRGLPTLAGLATIAEAARPGLSVQDCVARLKRYHYAFLRLHEILTARITAERPTAIIILTGFPDKTLIERGRECGVVAHLLKPIDIEDLRQAVDTGWLMFERGQRPA